jgi:hypothetical protein
VAVKAVGSGEIRMKDIIVFVSGFIASFAGLALMVGDTLWAVGFALISLSFWMLGKQWMAVYERGD